MSEDTIPINTTEAGGELERLRRENQELNDRVRLRDARDAMTAELERAGARSPALLFEAVCAEITYDDAGRAENIAALIEGIRRRFPEQFQRAPVPGPVNAADGARSAPASLTPEALRQMRPAEIARLDWEEVSRVLRSSR